MRSITSTLFNKTVLVLAKGDDSQTRDGRIVQCLGVHQVLNISSTMDRPMHLRILLLQTKRPDQVVDSTNLIINTGNKAPMVLTQFQPDITAKINTDNWAVLLDKRYVIYPRAASPDVTAPLIGMSNWSRTINLYKRHFYRIQYDLDTVAGTNTPMVKNLFWVYMLGFPNGGPVPTTPVAGSDINFAIQQYYYFKDI